METTQTRQLGASPSSTKMTVPFYVPPPSVKKTSSEIISEARASIRKGGTVGISMSPNEMGVGISPCIRPLDTKRPFTPRERQRTLFGTSNNYSRRPPSSFSLGYLQFQESDFGNTTPPNLRRLNPLPFSPSSSLSSSLNSSLSSSGSSVGKSSWRALVTGDEIEISDNLSTSLTRREHSGTANLQAPKFLPSFEGNSLKLRLPAIGSGNHIIARRNQFRATASLDNLPEELEGEDFESPGSSNSESSNREPPPMRKAYSSPVQRTLSRESDLEKDIFGPLEIRDLPSPTSNKRSLSFESENSRKKDKRLSSDGTIKKCKGDAWGLSQENELDHKVQRNSTIPTNIETLKPKKNLEMLEISSYANENLIPDSCNKKETEGSLIKEKCFNDLRSKETSFSKAKHNIRKEDKMEEDMSESHDITKFTENVLDPKKNIKSEMCSSPHINKEEKCSPNSLDILKENQTSYTLHNDNCGEIIESSSKMLQNLGVNDRSSIPLSPDTQYLARAKEALLADCQEVNSIDCDTVFENNSKNNKKLLFQEIGKNTCSELSPKASVSEVKNLQQECKTKVEKKYVPEDPILGAIQKAMLDRFPVKETVTQIQNISSRPKSAKKSIDHCISDNVRATLEMLSKLSQEDGNDIEVILALSKLYRVLDSENMFGLNMKNTKLKSQVLKVIYKFVERTNETLLLQIARIILAFRVNGSNLSGVCKLIFKVSRCDKNDRLFLEDNTLELFVEALGSASPLEDAEACIYGYGALKFLTMNNLVLSAVLGCGILELMILHMKLVNVARSEGTRIPEQTSHALFQLTGALRNVAGEEDMFPQFVSTGAVAELCRAMELFSSDLDVISNVSRTLSIISTHEDCCNAIINYDNCFHLFVKLLQKYPGRQDIVVRLGYALGNLMAKSESARLKLYEEEGAVSSMLNLLSIYLEKDQQMQDLEVHNHLITSDAGSNGSIEDVIVKIIRILANMSINPVVGANLCGGTPEVMFKYDDGTSRIHEMGDSDNFFQDVQSNEFSNRFLDILLTVLRRKHIQGSEELTHSALSSLNNLSYYTSYGNTSFGEREIEIAEVMSPVLNSENKECLVEALRVFGNLTRSLESRNFLLRNGDFSKLMKFLDSDDRELLSASAGILVNMMADWDKRVALKEDRGVERLLHILKTYCEGDWQLATLICQALWNYCIESTNLHVAFGIEETNELLGVLADYLDEERLFGVKEGTEINETLAASPTYQQWEEFAAVATNLLEKIDTFLDSLEPLEILPSPIEELPEPEESVDLIVENMNGHEE